MKDIAQMGYRKPTPVQIGAVPILMAKRNAMILAETGSGKSLAFILPLSEMIKSWLSNFTKNFWSSLNYTWAQPPE